METIRSQIIGTGDYSVYAVDSPVPPPPVSLFRCDAVTGDSPIEYVDLGDQGKVFIRRNGRKPFYIYFATINSKSEVIYVNEEDVKTIPK